MHKSIETNLPNLSIPNAFASILDEVESEANKAAGSNSAGLKSARMEPAETESAQLNSAELEAADADSADIILDELETAESVPAGVETEDYLNTVPDEAPEPEPPPQLSTTDKRRRIRGQPELQRVHLAKSSIIKVYNLSLTEAINTRGAEVAKKATLSELNQLIDKGCLMPVDKLIVKKLKAEKQLILPSKLFLKDKY